MNDRARSQALQGHRGSRKNGRTRGLLAGSLAAALLLAACTSDADPIEGAASPAAADASETGEQDTSEQNAGDDAQSQDGDEAENQGASDDAAADSSGASDEDSDANSDVGELAAEGLGSSQDNPVPLGETARHGLATFGQWDITVTEVDRNAAMSPTETPGEGRQRVEVSVSFTNRSDAATTPATALNQSGAADASTTYIPVTDGCAVDPEVDFSNPTLVIDPDGTSDRLMCWYAESANLDSFVVHFAPFYDGDLKLWFSLD